MNAFYNQVRLTVAWMEADTTHVLILTPFFLSAKLFQRMQTKHYDYIIIRQHNHSSISSITQS